MRRMITASFSILACCVVLVGCGQSERSVTFRLRYEPGSQITYRQDAVRHFKMTEGDSVLQQGNSNITMTITQTVRRLLQDSTADILESSKWDIIGPSKDDSTKIDTLHTSREMTVYITPRGKVVDLEFGTEVDSTEAKYIKDYYEQGFLVFPEEPLTKGASWTQTAKVDLPDTTAQAATTYTVKDFAKDDDYDVAIVTYDGNLIIPIVPSATDSLHRSGIDRIHITGTLKFAYMAGMVISIDEKWAVDGDRTRLKDSIPSHFKVAVNMDITYRLLDIKKST